MWGREGEEREKGQMWGGGGEREGAEVAQMWGAKVSSGASAPQHRTHGLSPAPLSPDPTDLPIPHLPRVAHAAVNAHRHLLSRGRSGSSGPTPGGGGRSPVKAEWARDAQKTPCPAQKSPARRKKEPRSCRNSTTSRGTAASRAWAARARAAAAAMATGKLHFRRGLRPLPVQLRGRFRLSSILTSGTAFGPLPASALHSHPVYLHIHFRHISPLPPLQLPTPFRCNSLTSLVAAPLPPHFSTDLHHHCPTSATPLPSPTSGAPRLTSFRSALKGTAHPQTRNRF